jgi:hypothetical protein
LFKKENTFRDTVGYQLPSGFASRPRHCLVGSEAFEGNEMIRMGLILGFIMSLAVIFAAYTETQGASVAEAQASVAPIQGCVTREVALDQGYGVTRTETRAVCAESSAAAAQ